MTDPARRAQALAPLPRRRSRPLGRGRTIALEAADAPLAISPPPRAVAARVVRWSLAGARLGLRLVADRLAGRRSPRDRARRLRETMEELGATAVKIGQQLSLRTDLLPTEICAELARLLDALPPMPLEHALARVEASVGRPLREVFRAIDPEPIGSASIACVYQAVLLDGTRVVLKVRRPGIAERFLADLTALGWLLSIAETLTLVRPGRMRHLKSELLGMFLEELDFLSEARYQTLFRRQARKDGLRYLSAPRVHPELSSRDVLVSDYADGLLLANVLAARESGDPAALERLALAGVDPARVGRRLAEVGMWSALEATFFHADPHPANLVVQPGDRLVLLDFGACGTTSTRSRLAQVRYITAYLQGDVQKMTQAMIDAVSPLPPVDVEELRRRVQKLAQGKVVVSRDEETPWWNRTTAALWLEFFECARDFSFPIQVDTVRSIRSSLLYDTVAIRLDPEMPIEVLHRYFERARRRAARRSRRKYRKGRAWRNVGLLAHQLVETLDDLRYRADSVLLDPPVHFASIGSKASSVLRETFRSLVILPFIIAYVAMEIVRSESGGPIDPLLVVAILFFVVTSIRRIVFRLRAVTPRRVFQSPRR